MFKDKYLEGKKRYTKRIENDLLDQQDYDEIEEKIARVILQLHTLNSSKIFDKINYEYMMFNKALESKAIKICRHDDELCIQREGQFLRLDEEMFDDLIEHAYRFAWSLKGSFVVPYKIDDCYDYKDDAGYHYDVNISEKEMQKIEPDEMISHEVMEYVEKIRLLKI